MYVEEFPEPAPRRVMDPRMYGILGLIVLILSVVIYGLVSGVFLAGPPRTATEFALTRAKGIIAASPGSGQAWGDYITLLYDLDRKGEAESALAEARRSVKDATMVYVNNAELRMVLLSGDNRKAADLGLKALKFDASARQKMADANAKRGISVPVGLKRDQNRVTVDTIMMYAQALGGLKQWDEAIKQLALALEMEPTSSDVLTQRGLAFMYKGDYETARLHFEEALKYIPDYAPALGATKQLDELEKKGKK